jgi:NAD(P)-dependent dehydrogenase (short-subunit alcohol dehydrogenase family)
MRNVIVWGASGGIGRAFVEAVADTSDAVVAVARDSASLRSVTPYVVDADLANSDSVARAMQAATSVAETFDLAIVAVGDIASSRAIDMDMATWRRLIENNLTAAFLTMQATTPHLATGGSLVVIGAVHERLRLPGLGAYAATKAAIEAYVDAWRKEARRRAVVVRPSAVDTPLWRKVPFALPRGAMAPADVASRTIAAVAAGHDGILDLAAS